MFNLSSTSLMHNATAMGGAVPYGGGGIGELREGAMGSAVRELQSKLNVLQYGPLTVDGTFGASTKVALQSFQQTEGIGVTGVLDSETEARLNQRVLNVSTGTNSNVNQSVSTAQAQLAQQPVRPWWQTGLMIAGGVAIAGGILYLLTDTESKDGYKRALTRGHEPKEVPGRYNSSGERVAGLHSTGTREKCDRTPSENAFDEGELLTLPQKEVLP